MLLLASTPAHAQTAVQSPADVEQRARIEQQLQELRSTKQEMQRRMLEMLEGMDAMTRQVREFDARIATLESQALGIGPQTQAHTQTESAAVQERPAPEGPAPIRAEALVRAQTNPAVAQLPSASEAPETAQAETLEPARIEPVAAHPQSTAEPRPSTVYDPLAADQHTSELQWGPYTPGKGFVVASGRNGEIGLGIYGYLRYLNQLDMPSTFTDAFGRTKLLDLRQDYQFNRLELITRGWLFDERLHHNLWVWTQNVSMGERTQINVGGTLSFHVSDAFTLTGGIVSLPTVRSTAQSFPNWLRIDHRTMADEFFRGSYTTAVMASGEIAHGWFYKAALGNNLSQIGVSADLLDNRFSTYSLLLWWAPTTGEFGPGFGFGDYEYHEKLATLFGVHYTYSPETAQEQPGVNALVNSQIRLSDGTLVFGPDPFNTGGTIDDATYRMLDLDAGFKYRGWSLEGEYYFRWVNDFDVVGAIPVTSLYDHGFQTQISTMLMPRRLQAYVSGSKILGQYGDPWDVGLGLTFFPFNRKQMRVNLQGLFMDRSAVGSLGLPYLVGGDGWVYTLDAGVWF